MEKLVSHSMIGLLHNMHFQGLITTTELNHLVVGFIKDEGGFDETAETLRRMGYSVYTETVDNDSIIYYIYYIKCGDKRTGDVSSPPDSPCKSIW